MEQVLVNLVVNARDAITHGGKIMVTTGNVSLREKYVSPNVEIGPGEYALLAVKDTGSGMDDRVKQHLFEPFFTTKEVGKGTGLGLPTVYGIVRQHQGYVEILSEVGKGTEVKIYLPRLVEPHEQALAQEKECKPSRGSETILVAEDEPLVRDALVRILHRLGYKVLEASNGAEALQLTQNYMEEIHLLLADMVMPQMSGKELAKKFRVIYPQIKVLFVSGYTDDLSVFSDLDKNSLFLQKPFTEDLLAQRLRELLGKTA
jgi:CheY-like chemotaxis protein